MPDYTISNETEWNTIAGTSLTSDDTVKLTASFTFLSTVLPAERITINNGVTFDGQGYVLTLATGNHTGLFNVSATSSTGTNIQNLGVIGTNATLLANCGFIINGPSEIHCNIYNCYVTGDIANQNCGGIIGRIDDGALNLYRCRYSGTLNGTQTGGLIGIFVDITETINIEECYSHATFSNSQYLGGLVGRFGGTSNSGTINIKNCYHYTSATPVASYLAGICGFVNTGLSTANVNITNCYCINSSMTYLQNGFPDDDIVVNFTNVIVDGANNYRYMEDGSGNELSRSNNNFDNTGTDISVIEGQLSGPASLWQSTSLADTWTAGTDTNYPTLDQFTLGPWTSYSTYTDEALLTTNYTGGNARGSSGGGGGDPHIFPLFGKTYDLPHLEETFLLLDNQKENNNDHLIIKGKCWYVPRHIYEKNVETHIEDGVSKLEYMDFYTRQKLTFFKYLKVEYNDEEYIFDMDSLEIKEYTNDEDFENGQLPIKKRYKKSDSIKISEIMKRYQLLFSKHVTRKSKFKYSQNAMAREITIKTKNNKINLTLISDPQKVDLRNSIELTVASNAKSFYGALIRRDIKTIKF